MKRVVGLLLLSVLLCNLVHAQKADRTWVVRANGGLYLSITNVSVEKALGKRHSVSLIPSYGYFFSGEANYETWGIGAAYRYYFQNNKTAPQGWYGSTGGSLVFGKAKIETNNTQVDAKGFNVQAVAGHQWIFRKGFTIDVNGGVQYIRLDLQRTDIINAVSLNWFLPTFGAGIGYAF